jgi:hypothetical protein
MTQKWAECDWSGGLCYEMMETSCTILRRQPSLRHRYEDKDILCFNSDLPKSFVQEKEKALSDLFHSIVLIHATYQNVTGTHKDNS